MNDDQKHEELLERIEKAMGLLERYKKLGLEVQAKATDEHITKLIQELNKRD